MIEDKCLDCGETVVNAEPGDSPFEKQDGTPCGGQLAGQPINWVAMTHG